MRGAVDSLWLASRSAAGSAPKQCSFLRAATLYSSCSRPAELGEGPMPDVHEVLADARWD